MLLPFLQHYSAALPNACRTTYNKLPCRNKSTRNHLSSSSVNRHRRHVFPIILDSADTMQTSLIRLHYKWGTVEEIIKKSHTVTILKGFSHFQSNTESQIFFCALFFTQVQAKLIEVSCSLAQQYQNLKPHLLGLFLTYCSCLINLWISPYARQCFENYHLKQNC